VIEKINLEKTNAWPFVEAKKILKERKKFIEKKGKIILQTGYGPSGLPHIGTFGEVARTTMVVNALNQLTDLPKEIITFSDDLDGLRKIPDNVPKKEILKNNLHKPLTSIPDPFGKYKSFGEHNNEMLKKFLNKFNFNYNFKSSSELYKSGFFNPTLKLILEKYQAIMETILPTLGKERQKTYSPFLPICPDTGIVLEIPVLEINKEKSKIIFDNNGKKLESSILDGNCKLQWKVDWAMRWYALDVDFEMYGKDLIESAILSTKIVKILGKTNPSGFAYELFLDEKGEKISKSKDEKLLFLLTINIVPILLMFLTSMIMGVKIRTMWMTPFYLFFGVLLVYIFQSQINLNKLKGFVSVFIILFILSPFAYAYVSLSKTDKRTDYPGKEIAQKVQLEWNKNFEDSINVVLGNEWDAGNLSYHLNSRPVWLGSIENYKLDELNKYICIDKVCVGHK